MKEIYLDHASTMPMLEESITAMTEAMRFFYANPSSLHKKGYEVEKQLTACREKIAEILGVSASEIFFTSGGTESNNMAIFGVARANQRKGKHIITSQIEHPSVLEALHQLEKEDFEITYLPVDSLGRVSKTDLLSAIREDTILVSIMLVNNEIGVIQDLEALALAAKQKNPALFFHSDCVQAFGKIKWQIPMEVDMVSVAGHKIGGPKGIGLLWVKKNTKIEPFIVGGKHQSGMRAGTESYPLVKALAVAMESARQLFSEHQLQIMESRDAFINKMTELKVDYHINGDLELSSPYILNISFPKIRAEVLLHALEEEGIYISTGSACQSKKNKFSHVLEAIKAPNKEGSIRLSFGFGTAVEDLIWSAEQISQKVTILQKFVRK